MSLRVDTAAVLRRGTQHLVGMTGHTFDVLTVSKPISPEAAVNLAKVVSKLSPLLGNLIEFNTVELLNEAGDFKQVGQWVRQDPGFPDAIFQGTVSPTPGFEIKAWFPLATEITARFKDSQSRFAEDNTHVAMLAWLPEFLIYGKPYILDVCVTSGLSIAQARDSHYHQPPDYLVVEPNDTSARTSNLQQTNTSGYKWQGTDGEFKEAKRIVTSWGRGATVYSPSDEYQAKVRELMSRFGYRLDTNYAKMDRIVHTDIEAFKTRVLSTTVHGMTVLEWNRLLSSGQDQLIRHALKERLGITEADADELLQ